MDLNKILTNNEYYDKISECSPNYIFTNINEINIKIDKYIYVGETYKEIDLIKNNIYKIECSQSTGLPINTNFLKNKVNLNFIERLFKLEFFIEMSVYRDLRINSIFD